MIITRRELLSSLVALSAGAALPNLRFVQAGDSGLRVNTDRLRQSLEGLSVFGRPAGGTFADGVSRIAFTDADIAGRKYAMERMRASGMAPRIDPAGNIFGLRSGSDQNLKPILFGSHIDSVPGGGNFDGDLGSMSAIEVMHTLEERGITTRHPLQMVIWTDEENTFAGSGAAAGVLRPGDLLGYATESRWPMMCANLVVTRRGWPKRAFSPAHSVATWSFTSSRAARCIAPMCRSAWWRGL